MLQTEICPEQNWSLEMPYQPSLRPQPQYWIEFLDPGVHDFIQCQAAIWHPHRESANPPSTSTKTITYLVFIPDE